jgi:glycosyltransferase involved in cell wall biosynthesis
LHRGSSDSQARLRVIALPVSEWGCIWVLSDEFIDKRTEYGKRHLDAVFRSATLLMVPSLAECYGLVYCEANAYGVPAVGCDVGGVSTIIRDGENGFLIKGNSFTTEDGERILELLQNRFAYEAMAKASRAAYDERLNWEVAGKRALAIIYSRLCGEIPLGLRLRSLEN